MRGVDAGKRVMRASRWTRVCAILALAAAGCATISAYDPTSYKNATDLKAESLYLVAKSTDTPDKYANEINKVQIQLQQDFEYEKGKGRNGITVEQWRILADPDKHLLAGFLKKWQAEKKSYPQAFVDGVSKNIADAFDQIIRLEQGKVKQ